jgi:hypothetical protein
MIPLPQLALMAIWVLCLHSVYLDGCKAKPQPVAIEYGYYERVN